MQVLNQKALDEKMRETRAVVSEKILRDIADFLHTAHDAQLYNINPWRFASQRKLNRMATLKAFLHLTKKGLFNLYWTIHCPSCKGATQQSESLASLKHADRCAFCKVDFNAGFDKSIEVSFAVNPAIIRPAEVAMFEKLAAALETEPGISIELDPGESHFLSTTLAAGNYLLFAPDDQKVVNIAVTEQKGAGVQKIAIDYRDGQELLEILTATQGPAEITIRNAARARTAFRFARLAEPRWPSAAVVSSLQEFRDLFSSQMLSLDETFSIESLGFLFTDIKGSTELYERLGDAQAFALVKEHFTIMERIVRENNGGIVKTIGDAVMAVFVDPRDTVRAAVEMIDAFDDMETARKLENAIIIKVGIHYGPCIAVTLNERLDYFGTTVNIAARVQGLSDGRNIMASGPIVSESSAADFLLERKWHSESFVTSLKGLKANYQVYKMFRPGA